MHNIDKLIYDELARRRSVVLPGAGTLEVKRRKAKRISEDRIVPPQNVVVFSTEEQGGVETVASLVAADRNIPLDEASAVYGSWLENARRPDGSVVIYGAGEVRDGRFATSGALLAALNPEGEEAVDMPARRKNGVPAWVWIVLAIIAALAILWALRCCNPTIFGGRPKPPTVEAVPTVAPSTADADSLAAANAASSSTGVAASAQTAATTAGRFHVIAGAFAIESNADGFVARVKREHPELTPMKLPHPRNGYMMVSIWQAPTEREARGKMNLYWDVNLDLWIYEQK